MLSFLNSTGIFSKRTSFFTRSSSFFGTRPFCSRTIMFFIFFFSVSHVHYFLFIIYISVFSMQFFTLFTHWCSLLRLSVAHLPSSKDFCIYFFYVPGTVHYFQLSRCMYTYSYQPHSMFFICTIYSLLIIEIKHFICQHLTDYFAPFHSLS